MDATYEWSDVQTWNLHHSDRHELRNWLLGKLFLLLPFTANKVEIHEETSIVNNRFNVTWINNDHNLAIPLVHCNQTKIFKLGQIKWYPSFNHWPLPSPRTSRVKKLMDFFQNTQCISMFYTEKSVLHYCVRLSQIWSHMVQAALLTILIHPLSVAQSEVMARVETNSEC